MGRAARAPRARRAGAALSWAAAVPMRTITDAQQAVYLAAGGSFPVHFRAFLSNDNGSTWLNLRELAGRDWLLGVTWEETIDQGVTEARLMVVRQLDSLSLSPEMTTSALNQEGGGYMPLLRPGKTRVLVEVAPKPLESAPVEGDWVNAWEGFLCGVADSGEGMLELYCRDLLWPLVRTFIERERPYGDADVGVDVETVIRQIFSDNYLAPTYKRWAPSTAYSAGDKVIPTAGKATGFWYVCTTSGTSGGTEPSWPSTPTLFSDGSAQWLLDVNPLSPKEYLLYTPTSPGWLLGLYSQQMESTFTAVETLALQLGWHLRMRYDATLEAWRPTFYQPDRDKVVPDYTLSTYHRRAVPSWGGTVDDIRNKVRVGYWDKDDLDAAGNPKLKEVVVEDTDSQDTYGGVYFMNFTPGAAANIDTLPEATTLANSALKDLAQPPVDVEVDTPFLHHVELGDLLQLPPDNVHHDTAKNLSVTRVVRTLTGSKAGMTISLRGTPMVARAQWLLRQGARGNAVVRPENGPEAVTGLTVTPTASGVAVSFTPSVWGRGAEEYELHLSTSSGFTPDDTTFYAKGKQTTFNVTDLDPGVTYYAKVVPREKGALDKPGVRGTVSSQASFTARYVEPRTLQPRVTYAALPLNSDFEAANDPLNPPDQWEMTTGTWGTDAELVATPYTGTNSVRLRSGAVLSSQMWSAREGDQYSLDVVFRPETVSTASGELKVEWFDETFTSLGVDAAHAIVFSGTTGAWHRGTSISTTPANTRYMRVNIYGDLFTAGRSTLVDSIIVTRQNTVRATWSRFWDPSLGDGSTDYTNSWVPFGTSLGQYVEAYLDPNTGMCTLRGQLKNGTSGASALTLFVGFRPVADTFRFAYSNGGVLATVQIKTTGEILITTTDTSKVDLGGIVFHVF